MSDMKFSEDHEWITVEGDIATVGITQFAQEQLGDVVFVELPDVGKAVAKGDEVAVVESVKAAAEVYTPVSGEVSEVNEALDAAPETVNSDPQGGAWFFKIKLADTSELDELMDAAAYDAFASEEG
ncbi:MAG: glycine cleavage system protein H [Rhodospirillaceae bacterium]|nr:glycine cleavage system protein H [Rhodospirillaceae bacterium]HAA93515.1 glycine cleavage system protein GcvH [Rhodospirillaceae bacterium]|tara:strand:+ start:359 stop:736 length:378 start_codon:yes stop_codon:yes gene_type:complete